MKVNVEYTIKTPPVASEVGTTSGIYLPLNTLTFDQVMELASSYRDAVIAKWEFMGGVAPEVSTVGDHQLEMEVRSE